MDSNQVDMMGEARNAQWTPQFFLGDDYLRIISPAKVNLFLDVGAKGPDGYHDVATVIHSLLLSDSVFMASSEGRSSYGDGASEGRAGHASSLAAKDDGSIAFGGPAGNIAVKIEMVDRSESFAKGSPDSLASIPAKDNLAFKAVDKLAKAIGRSKDEQIAMRIEKSIPASAGLGGGSSNAAAALLGAAHIWGVSDSGETLKEVARELGADVTFFLHGGCCAFLGRGDSFERSLSPANGPVVVIKPSTGVPTALAYKAFDADPKKVSAEDWVGFENAADAESVPLVNNLTDAAEAVNPEVAIVLDWLSTAKGLSPLLSGSGSAAFAKTATYSDALALVAEAKSRGWWGRATSFSPLAAQVVESR